MDWPSCGGRLRGRVRLRAVVDPTCTRVRGVLRGGRPGTGRRLVGARLAVCGNGVLESYESCDDGNTAEGDCCTVACQRGFADGCPAGCGSNAECGPDAYCYTGFDDCGSSGACRARPFACTDLYDPACGCDGTTYANRCEAAAAGASLLDLEHCARPCGTIAGLDCADGEFCEFPERSCRIVDLGGTCAPIPRGCPRNRDPVCGCDGGTYANDCVRRAQRVQLAHEGVCARR